MNSLGAAITIAMVSLGGLFGVEGNGHIKEETRSVPAFTGVEVSGGITADVTVGPEQKVILSADENLLPLLRTRVVDGVLRVDHEGSIRSNNTIKLTVVTPKLDRLGGSGGCTVHAKLGKSPKLKLDGSGGTEMQIAGIDTDALDLDMSGGVTAVLQGTAKKANLDLSGGVELHAKKLQIADAVIDASGGVQAELAVSQSIRGDASGGVSVEVKGRPAVKVDTSGGSSVETGD